MNELKTVLSVADVLATAKKLFFVGIGGISMSSLAFVCKRQGFSVAGSDRAYSALTERLEADGIPVTHEHRAENIDGADAVVYTGAVDFTNPELKAATEKNIPVIYRADLLGHMMRDYKHRIGISGMHGKSTCTSMIAHLFIAAGKDPTVLSGAETREMNGAYRLGSKDFFIFEACEYKDSFLYFYPTMPVVLDIDLDHTDYFTGGLEQIKRSFLNYSQLPFSYDCEFPCGVMCVDDEDILDIISGVPACATFGIHEERADYRAKNICESRGKYAFDVYKKGEFFTHVTLPVPGYHNIYNALGALVVADLLGLSADEISSGFLSFEGLHRRFDHKGDVNGAPVYIDYAHHPREIRATLEGARKMTDGKLVCFFEPHTYSRTSSLFDEFVASFAEADLVYILDIYAAREINTSGVSAQKLAKATPGGVYVPSYEEAVRIIRRAAEPGDTVLILGAGTVDRVAKLLFDEK